MILPLAFGAAAACSLFACVVRSGGDERALVESIERLAARMFGAGLVLLFVVLVLAAIR